MQQVRHYQPSRPSLHTQAPPAWNAGAGKRTEGLGEGGEALQQGQQVPVGVVQQVPALQQGGHDGVQVLHQLVPLRVRQRRQRVVQDAHVLARVPRGCHRQRLQDGLPCTLGSHTGGQVGYGA